MIPKLRPGTVTIDIETGGIYGDLDHNPREWLLESAEALLSLLPQLQHKGLWGLHKSFWPDCYVYTRAKGYKAPPGLTLEQNMTSGPIVGSEPWHRPFELHVVHQPDKDWVIGTQHYWDPPVGRVVDGKVTPDTEGVPDPGAERRAEYKREIAERLAESKRAAEKAKVAEAKVQAREQADAAQERMF
ncbi:MAG: hypothetical protein HY680_06850 [Chloroflexi bacterium]|nr:hypothetical protein [Chloroflexota bacterium]